MPKLKYNIECLSCGDVFTVEGGPLWWRAKKLAETGRLDALRVSGVECGCEAPVVNPDAPYRVCGYDYDGSEYDMPFSTFVGAIKAFRQADHFGEIVFIKGVSPAVADKLKYG